MARARRVDAIAASLGYRRIGGMRSNRVYLDAARAEVLKVSLARDADALDYTRAHFRRCLDVSSLYAREGIMPEVLEVGDDFQGTGCPWLRERYVDGHNLAGGYLAEPGYWLSHAPREIVRLCRIMAAQHSEDVSQTWQEKIDGLTCPPGFETLGVAIAEAGKHLASRYRTGHVIHGDLQFGNLVATRERGAARLWLVDWEVSEVMPLGYELAMLYTFLLGPEGQVESRHRRPYARLKPLRDFWEALAPLMRTELAVTADELTHSVVFRMGNAWLYQLDQALRRGDGRRAGELEADLTLLVSRRCFDLLPYPRD